MHGDREEEDGVAVVGPRASTEVLLHGLHNGEELVCQHSNVMEDDLEWEQETPELANCLSARHHTPEPRRQKQWSQGGGGGWGSSEGKESWERQ